MLLFTLVGCTSAGKPGHPPRLDEVSPATSFVDEATPARLLGEFFTPKASVRWGGGTGDVSVNPAFEVFVADQKLNPVEWVDSKTLTAVVPAGLPLGKQAVRLVDPYGQSTVLEDALEILPRRGGRLIATLSTGASAVRVLKEIVAHLDLTNVGDAPVVMIGPLQLPAMGSAEVTALGVSLGQMSLKPGESTRFELTWVSTKVGDEVLWAEARGVDQRTGLEVRVEPLSTAVQIVPPPDIISTLVATQKTVSRGQVIELVLEATNVGGVAVRDLLPTAVATPPARVDLKNAPLKRDVPVGAKQPFSFFFDTLATGSVSFRVDALGLDALTGATVAMSPAVETVNIINPAQLAVAVTQSATRIAVGQRFTLTAMVTNSGDARALAVVPTLALSGVGALSLVSAPGPAAVGGSPVSFVWVFDGATRGGVQLTVGAGGSDEYSGLPVNAAPMGGTLVVGQRASLTATFTTPARVNVGQSFGWSLEVANAGDSMATLVGPGPIAVLGSAILIPDAGPVPTAGDIPPGGLRSFVYTSAASAGGPLGFQARPSGTDAIDAMPVTAALASSAIIQVDRPARLDGVLSIPPSVAPASQFNATMQVTNSGQAVALSVTPSALVVSGSATVVSGPVPATAALAADGGVTFTWVLAAGTTGTAQVSGSASGTDANDAKPLSTGPLTSNLAAMGGEVTLLATDPFADATAFSYIFSYAGKVWLGPRKTGFGAVAMNPDGTGAANYAFAFARDVGNGGTSHANTSAAPYPSIGTLGCTANTPACGPHNENGRGIFFSGTLQGIEFLGIAGANLNGAINYVYLSNDTASTLNFRFVDISAALGGSTKGISAAHAFKNRLYLGFPDSGGTRPYLLSLLSPVPTPGLNAVVSKSLLASTDVLDLESGRMPGLGQFGGNTTPVVMIDALTDFNDRLYVANNGGIIRTTTATPVSPVVSPADWSLSTPTAAGYTSKTSQTSTKMSEIIPSDKAFPALVSYQGRLYAARNTLSGPQLWVCDPGVDGFCAPSEWSLIAFNNQGDGQLSQFNDAANNSIGLLAATATTLFVGFNNPMGVQIFKTMAATPTTRADFTGALGCVAGVVGCQGLGGNGLGAAAINRQIFDARALTFGAASWLYLVTGNGVSGVRIWRTGG